MNIIIIQGAFLPIPPIRGGAVEKMWFSLGKEFVNQGHNVTHVSRLLDGLAEHEIIDGVNYIRVKGYDIPKSGIFLKFLDLLYTIKVRKVINYNYDIVITNTFWAPLVLPNTLSKRCVVDVQRMPKGQIFLYKKVLILRANSTPVANSIKKELPKRLQKKVVMIPNPVPFDINVSVEYYKKNVILYTGRIHPEKGLEILINAFKKLSNSHILKIVGPWEISEGGGGVNYLNKLKQLAGDVLIQFIGPVFDTDTLNKFYAEASLFAYPSIAEQGETFGLAPLEAMAWGCVPIVSDLSCFKDFIFSNKNGLIFDHRAGDGVSQLADCMRLLCENKELCVKLSNKALEVRQTHAFSHIAKKFISEFNTANYID